MKLEKTLFPALLCCLALVLLAAAPCRAHDATNALIAPSDGGFFSDWFARVTRIQAEQPSWMTPVFTTTPRLDEEFHYDTFFESTRSGHIDNFGASKGLELIPYDNIQVNASVPPWISRDRPSDGFSDESFLVKYRLLTANAENGDYILTTFIGLTVPTGAKRQTSDRYTLTPSIAGGKGWGRFDFQSTLGVSLPSNDGTSHRGPGAPIGFNTAFQYRVGKLIWPQLEANYTYWPDGATEGRNQLFLTPGIIFGRFPIWNRLRFVIGAGYQVAVTQHPFYHNNFILTVRTPF